MTDAQRTIETLLVVAFLVLSGCTRADGPPCHWDQTSDGLREHCAYD